MICSGGPGTVFRQRSSGWGSWNGEHFNSAYVRSSTTFRHRAARTFIGPAILVQLQRQHGSGVFESHTIANVSERANVSKSQDFGNCS